MDGVFTSAKATPAMTNETSASWIPRNDREGRAGNDFIPTSEKVPVAWSRRKGESERDYRLGEAVEDRFPLAVLGQVKGAALYLVVMVGRYAEGMKHGGVEIGYGDGILGH